MIIIIYKIAKSGHFQPPYLGNPPPFPFLPSTDGEKEPARIQRGSSRKVRTYGDAL